jgi:hypothetical protein
MISNLNELKQLIIWAKEQGITAIKVGDIQVEISPAAVMESMIASGTVKSEPLDTSKTLTDAEELDPEEEKQLKYWSSRGM